MVAALLHGVGIGLFIAAAGTAIGVIADSLIPRWSRIVRLAGGESEQLPQVSDRISHLATGARRRQPLQAHGVRA